jgi:hypothetical protein
MQGLFGPGFGMENALIRRADNKSGGSASARGSGLGESSVVAAAANSWCVPMAFGNKLSSLLERLSTQAAADEKTIARMKNQPAGGLKIAVGCTTRSGGSGTGGLHLAYSRERSFGSDMRQLGCKHPVPDR